MAGPAVGPQADLGIVRLETRQCDPAFVSAWWSLGSSGLSSHLLRGLSH